MACDRCGKAVNKLCDIRDIYQTDTCRKVCAGCMAIAEKELSHLRSVSIKWQKKKIHQLFNGGKPVRVPWWRRICN